MMPSYYYYWALFGHEEVIPFSLYSDGACAISKSFSIEDELAECARARACQDDNAESLPTKA